MPDAVKSTLNSLSEPTDCLLVVIVTEGASSRWRIVALHVTFTPQPETIGWLLSHMDAYSSRTESRTTPSSGHEMQYLANLHALDWLSQADSFVEPAPNTY